LNIYVSDSGGGIPAAAKVLGINRRGCLLHTLDTVQGRAIGEKEKIFSHGDKAPQIKALIIEGYTELKALS
jgi:hypothetical protein